VGLTPKLTSRIFRFQRALAAANGVQTTPDWSDLAVDCGYYDQAHLIHEFQQLAGLTPSDYLRSRTDFPLYVAVE
jgi:AraC-like DNA-binding protein